MAYSELIKNFERIRDYMREFYVYGFKSREEYDTKSARSYDNERRRIESWMGDYMSFHQDATGKNVFLSVDSRRIPHNPLHKAFKAKSFTDKDITLHFYILDILADGDALSSTEIVDRINDDYLSHFDDAFSLDESTVRKKLKEYETIGLLKTQKSGREVLYQRTDDESFDLSSWSEALAFYSEADPIGVIGSYLMDKLDNPTEAFRFKHHYILHALDSDVLCEILQAIDEQRAVELTIRSLRNSREYQRTICPLKIYISTQGGRQYLLCYHNGFRKLMFFCLDYIQSVETTVVERRFNTYMGYCQRFQTHLWGTSSGVGFHVDHLEMTLHFDDDEQHIPHRLEREKRNGAVELLDQNTVRYCTDVYDASELLPWLRTFTGRIEKLECSDPTVVQRFYDDLAETAALYGGET